MTNEAKKVNNGITEMVFIIDKSGSMAGLEADTIGGFNAMIEKQKEEDGKVYVSTVLFSNTSMVSHDRVDLARVEPLNRRQYRVGGCTALLDAIGDAIRHIRNIHKYARPEDVPEHTIFCIMTDGMENASRKYSKSIIKEDIENQTQKFGWEFIFLGANIDSFKAAEHIGITRDHVANWDPTPNGMMLCHDTFNFAITNARKNRKDRIDLEKYMKEKQKEQ